MAINPPPIVPPTTLADELKKDVWVHIGGLISIALGAADIFWGPEKLGLTTDVILIIGGLAAQGVKIANGSAATAASAAAGAIANMAAQVAAQVAADRVAAAQAAPPPPAPPAPVVPPGP